MNLRSGKGGYILAVIMMFAAILMTSVLGIHAYVKYFAREVWLQDVEHARSYYAAFAGLRYASILLKNQVYINSKSFLEVVAEAGAGGYLVTGNELGGDLWADIKGPGPATLTVRITEITSGSDTGKYTVIASYNG